MRMAADTASARSISGDVREVFILVDPLERRGPTAALSKNAAAKLGIVNMELGINSEFPIHNP
jgi:hypothetical protein